MFDLHHPVVSDPSWGVTVGYTGYSIALPAMHQLAAGGEILRRNTRVNESQVVGALP